MRSGASGWRPSARRYSHPVRLVVARCSVDYIGRLTAHLPPAIRLLMVKADNSVLVHADGGSYKPLNWMSPPCWLVEQPGRWVVQNKAGEQLMITIDEVLHDSRHDLGVDPISQQAKQPIHTHYVFEDLFPAGREFVWPNLGLAKILHKFQAAFQDVTWVAVEAFVLGCVDVAD